jgi:hypothetical protein
LTESTRNKGKEASCSDPYSKCTGFSFSSSRSLSRVVFLQSISVDLSQQSAFHFSLLRDFFGEHNSSNRILEKLPQFITIKHIIHHRFFNRLHTSIYNSQTSPFSDLVVRPYKYAKRSVIKHSIQITTGQHWNALNLSGIADRFVAQ